MEEKLNNPQATQEENVASAGSLADEKPAGTETTGAGNAVADQVARLEGELAEQIREHEELFARFQRLQADFENFRRRTRQEKEDLGDMVTAAFCLELLPIKDNLERALASARKSNEINALIEGVELILRQFNALLENKGVTPIAAVGEVFDPDKHEAVMQVDDENYAEPTVIEELQTGYIYKNKRVIRPSMVKVAKKS